MVDRLPDSFPDDNRPGPEIRAQDAEAADFCVGSDPANHARYRRAVPENVNAIARLDFNLDTSIDHLKVMEQSEAGESRVIDLDSGIDHGDPDAFARALFQGTARLL
jgi:hypothetical protein